MSNYEVERVIFIQKWYRGYIFRMKRLPLIMYKIQHYLKLCHFQFSSQTSDGRINSCIDEENVLDLLSKKFQDRIRKSKIRNWHDLLVYDNYYGWLPVNIKTTSTANSDNVGNLALCVYAYTNNISNTLDDLEKEYKNGEMSEVLLFELKNKNYNRVNKKDYYFLVLNKTDPDNVIVNSVKGLSHLTPNANNLPFQVSWKKNDVFTYDKIVTKVSIFIQCLQKPAMSWKEKFMMGVRKINI
jgi:hypothetical protein